MEYNLLKYWVKTRAKQMKSVRIYAHYAPHPKSYKVKAKVYLPIFSANIILKINYLVIMNQRI